MSTPQDYASTVNSFYLAFYGRPADPVGLKFWTEQLDRLDGDLAAITEAFATSEEAKVRFSTDSVSARITQIYEQLFNRAPEADGLAFWTKAVEQGHATLAEVSVSILKGAQGSDLDLSVLRQQAADAFTAQVETSGSAYDGYASIEAARVLVRAVTLDATADDVASLVKAAVTFADVATRTPAVVDAIASGGPLLDMFDTPRGLAEPVALLQTLADTAKAAAGNPVTLDSLLRGGGMTKVLEVMPAKATLKDVADALVEGGLPAAVEVVYPTKPVVKPAPPVSVPPEPPVSEPSEPVFKISFDSVTEGTGDTHRDHVTNVGMVDVKFSYTGNDLADGERFEFSLDGEHWYAVASTDTETNTVLVKNILVNLGFPVGDAPAPAEQQEGGQNQVPTTDPYADLATMVRLRAVDAAGETIASASQQIIHDRYVAAPTLALADDTAGEHTGTHDDKVTSDGTLVVSGIEAGAKVEYQTVVEQIVDDVPPPSTVNTYTNSNIALDPNAGSGSNSGSTGNWSTTRPTAKEGLNTYYVRQTDAAGNVNESQISFTLDTKAPTASVVTLVEDTGTAADGVSANGTMKITGLEENLTTAWEYKLDGGEWLPGKANDGSGSAALELPDLDEGGHVVLVRQVDAAGNLGTASGPLAFTLDLTAPTNALSFDFVEDSTMEQPDTTTLASAKVFFRMTGSLANGEFVEWRVQGGNDEWTKLASDEFMPLGDTATIVPFRVDGLDKSDPVIEIRVSDAAGNHTKPFTQKINGPFDATPSFTTTATARGVQIDSNFAGSIVLDGAMSYDVKSVESGGGAVVGTTFLEAQTSTSVGVVALKQSNGNYVFDDNEKVYFLGTNNDDSLSGMNHAWGFDGKDTLSGTSGADFLVGGKGGDYIYAGYDDKVSDTIIIGAGETGTGERTDGSSTADLDVIGGLGSGDVIQLGDVFTANPAVGTTFLIDSTPNQVAIVRGIHDSGFFQADDSSTAEVSYMLQWSGNGTVNSVVLDVYGNVAPTFAFDIENGTITLVGMPPP